MLVTNIVPCIKVTKESNMSGCDSYIELGEHIKIRDNKNNIFVGRLSFIELGKDEEEEDVISILTDDEEIVDIGMSYIEDIEAV
jgi:hypothetical protein